MLVKSRLGQANLSSRWSNQVKSQFWPNHMKSLCQSIKAVKSVNSPMKSHFLCVKLLDSSLIKSVKSLLNHVKSLIFSSSKSQTNSTPPTGATALRRGAVYPCGDSSASAQAFCADAQSCHISRCL